VVWGTPHGVVEKVYRPVVLLSVRAGENAQSCQNSGTDPTDGTFKIMISFDLLLGRIVGVLILICGEILIELYSRWPCPGAIPAESSQS
jgi:hypothetical protein